MNNIRIGLVGAGYGAQMHVEGISQCNPLAETFVYDLDSERGSAFARKNKIYLCNSVETLITNVDAVVIATPNSTHYYYCMKALEMNRSVLCEKPMSTNVKQALQMCDIARKKDLVCSIGFNYRFFPCIIHLKKMQLAGKVGELLFIKMKIQRHIRKDGQWRNASDENKTGGVLGDLGIHLIDLIHYISGGNIDINSCLVNLKSNYGKLHEFYNDDEALLIGRLENGVYFQIEAVRTVETRKEYFEYLIIGNKVDISYNSKDINRIRIKENDKWRKVELEEYRQLNSNSIFDLSYPTLMQDSEWLKIISTSRRKGIIADFNDGLVAQNVLDKVLDKYYMGVKCFE